MDFLIKSAKIIDPRSKHHLQIRDVLISNGKIKKIEKEIKSKPSTVIDEKDLHLSVGWIDMHANFQDPGFEHKETIENGLAAAAAGGFTKVGISPLTKPIRDSKAQVEYLINSASNKLVDVLPYGTISLKAEGKELAELNDMKNSGAIAFYDGKNSIDNPNLLCRALEYSKAFDGLIINFPHTKEIAAKGVMNEGLASTQLGLKGIPEIAESLMVARDLFLLEYTCGKLHFNTISTKKSLELIAKARKAGHAVSCDVASYSLLLHDSELNEFDSRYKTLPPLRSKATIQSLIKGVKDGSIQAICSDHLPEDIDNKKKELDHAAFGIINLQTAFSSANTALKKNLNISQIIHLFTSGPAEILGIDLAKITEGETANLTLFQPNESFTFQKEMVKSKSKNSPFFKMELTGKVVGVVNNKELSFTAY